MSSRSFFFFFSSRRRHTRYWRDWSSDVCSSDLHRGRVLIAEPLQRQRPGGVDSAVVAAHVAAGQQSRPVGAEAAQVVSGRQLGLLEIAGDLGGGQRQIPEIGGQLVGQLLFKRRNPRLE